MAGAFGSFTVSRLATFRAAPVRRSRRPRPFLLSHEELATLWHPPTAIVGLAHLQATEFTELEAPTILNARKGEGTAGGAVLGRAKYRSEQTVVELAPDDRRRHLYVVGKTGMGKTSATSDRSCRFRSAATMPKRWPCSFPSTPASSARRIWPICRSTPATPASS